jgi:hypothetical protein
MLYDFVALNVVLWIQQKPRGLFHKCLIWAPVGGVGRGLHMLVIGTWGENGNLGWFGEQAPSSL